ncbi:G2H3 [Mytilus coruscus]|uniref:G2H3 n=1 Tax=Mytilus coruscus TaxID=42192 RepID=A0A6J8A7N8_MYTCO|nr:G2H3 [Mytilus coruscus]
MQIPQADRNASMNSDQENTGSSAITFHPSCLERRERRSRLSLRSSTGNDALACPSTYRSYVQLFETEIVTVDDSDDEGDKTIPMDGRAIKGNPSVLKKQDKCEVYGRCGIAEGAVDEGGPKREFLRMLMKKIQYLHILKVLKTEEFWPIVHQVMYNALVGQAGERNIEDIADGDLRGEVQKGNEKLTAEMMEVVFMDIKMSVPGSNRRRDEENIVGYWRDFLIDLQEDEDGEITLGDVLSFATGADCVPPLGFDPSPSITFSS